MNTFWKVGFGLFALTIAFDLGGEYQKSIDAKAAPVATPYAAFADPAAPAPPATQAANFDPSTARPVTPEWAGTPAPQASSSGSYVNVDGNTVQSPTFTSDGSAPAGASARCSDGSWSFSQHRQGTCSHHGGVAQWQ